MRFRPTLSMTALHRGELTTEPERISSSGESMRTTSSGRTIRAPTSLSAALSASLARDSSRRSIHSNHSDASSRTMRAVNKILQMTTRSSTPSAGRNVRCSRDTPRTPPSPQSPPCSTSSSSPSSPSSSSDASAWLTDSPSTPRPSSPSRGSRSRSRSRSHSHSHSHSYSHSHSRPSITETGSSYSRPRRAVVPEPIMPYMTRPYADIQSHVPYMPGPWHPEECRGNWVGVNFGRECAPVLTRFRDSTCRWCGRMLGRAEPRADGRGRLGGVDGLVADDCGGFVLQFPGAKMEEEVEAELEVVEELAEEEKAEEKEMWKKEWSKSLGRLGRGLRRSWSRI